MRHIAAGLLLSLCMIKASAEEEMDSATATVAEGSYASAATLGIIKNRELIELSGIVSGGINKDLLWVHNDRKNLPRLYALNRKGETVGTYNLNAFGDSGMMSGDWEDIARVPGSGKDSFDLYIGDIGNNPMVKREHKILIVSEPSVDPNRSSEIIDIEFKTIRFEFPEDYICNNEALLIHPVTRTIYIVSKGVQKGREGLKNIHVWAIPAVDDYERVFTARLVMGSIPAIEEDKGKVTGGDISSDGQSLILTTHKSTGYLWELKETTPLKKTLSGPPSRIDLAKEKGSEAICFSLDKSELFTVYDGKKMNRPLHVYPRKIRVPVEYQE